MGFCSSMDFKMNTYIKLKRVGSPEKLGKAENTFHRESSYWASVFSPKNHISCWLLPMSQIIHRIN